MTGIEGRIILVTGAAQGIGAACARRFVAHGARVVLADRDAAAGAALAEALGERAVFAPCDVTRRADLESAAGLAIERWGGIDVLVNNAGIVHAAPFLDLAEEDFDRVLAVNLRSYFVAGQVVARHMVRLREAAIARGEPAPAYSIVNLSSANAVLAIPDQVPYVVSKGGVNQLTKVMALALADHGIRVNGVGPGTIATELARRAVLGSDTARRRSLSRTPLKRLGEPEEVAAVVEFLASDAASYLTGQTLYPDGGRLALNYTVAVD